MPGDFRTAIVILCAAMMKRRSSSVKNEYDYFKKYYERQFREHVSVHTLTLLRTAANSQLHISRICYKLSFRISYEERLHILHFLYGFTFSDHFIAEGELRIIRLIGRFLMIDESDLDSVYAMYFIKNEQSENRSISGTLESYFKILGVSLVAGHDEIRKAYRILAMKHHPDKVAHLGEEMQESAKIMFQVIVDAYKKIRRAKGF